MQVKFLINGDIQLLLSPENTMEEELLKGLMKQDNSITEIRGQVTVLNKTMTGGILVGKRTNNPLKEGEKPETSKDDKG